MMDKHTIDDGLGLNDPVQYAHLNWLADTTLALTASADTKPYLEWLGDKGNTMKNNVEALLQWKYHEEY